MKKPAPATETDQPATAARSLSPEHVEELRKSAVSESFARSAGVYTESDPANVGRMLNWKGPANDLGPTLVFRFFGPDGQPMVYAAGHGHRREYVQIKPTTPRLAEPSLDHPGGRIIKYDGPVGSQARPYVPSPVAALVYSSAQILLITEGMKKALAAAELGYAVVGLTGVWNWGAKKKTQKEKARLNADFDTIPLKGRTIVVVFDSDAGLKKGVADAEAGLVHALREVGAAVVVLRLEAGAGGEKVGLDDYVFTHGAAAFKAMIAHAVAAKPDGEQRPADELKVAAVKALAAIGRGQADLWHDDANAAWATIGRRSMKVKSPTYKQWLTNEYRKQAKDIPPAEALNNAINVIESEAIFDKPVREANVRIAGHGGKVYVALYDAAGTVVEVGPGWWRPCETPPVRFFRPPAALPLPIPETGGDLAALRDILNLPDDTVGDEAFALLTAWLCGCFRPPGPGAVPILRLGGDHGAAKSTTAMVCKRLTDPAKAPLRKPPKESRDLMITAVNTWVLAFDNLSSVPEWFSNDLCCLATGGGFGARELYANDQEAILDAKRPVILAGITDFVKAPDLLDRIISVRLPSIPEEKRVTEANFWAEFEAQWPKLLGAMLDRVAAGLKNLSKAKLTSLPRMADFCEWAFACEGRMVEADSPFLAAYASNRTDSQEQALENSLVAQAVIEFMRERPSWKGTATELLTELSPPGPATDKPPKGWPTCSTDLTNKILVVAADLRKVHGIEFGKGRENYKNRSRFVSLTRGSRTSPGPDGRATDKAGPGSINDVNDYRETDTVQSRTSPDKTDKGSRSPSPGRTKFGPNSSATAAKGGAL